MALKLRQGLSTDRLSITPSSGELIYTTDTKEIYVGDGTTAGGNSISSAIPTNLNALSDVVITTASNGQVLKYNGTNWINAAESGGVTDLNALTDVVLTSPSNGQVLKYNGTNWINDTAPGGGMTSFNVTGDDSSVTRSIGSGETLNFMGSGSITVNVTAGDQIMITNNERVQTGSAGSLAYYENTSSSVRGSGVSSLNFDNTTGTLFADKVTTNRIVTDTVLPIINKDQNAPFVLVGGVIDGQEYTSILVCQSKDLDPVFQVHSVFKNTFDTQFCNAIQLQRSRGTLTAETSVQAGDFLGTLLWMGFDGTDMLPGAYITSSVDSISPLALDSTLTLGINDNTFTPQNILSLKGYKHAIFEGAVKVLPQILDFTSGNITLLYTEIQSNYLYSSPSMTANRDLTLPSPSLDVIGLRLCIFNKDATWTITVKYGSTTIVTVGALSKREIYCDGTNWDVLY